MNEPHPDNQKTIAQLQMRDEKYDDEGGPVYPSTENILLPRPDAPGRVDSYTSSNPGISLRNQLAKEMYVHAIGELFDLLGGGESIDFKQAHSVAQSAFQYADIFIQEMKRHG
jgi:hypothetical protein